MSKYLTDSAGAGKKIQKYKQDFKYSLVEKSSNGNNKMLYRFEWSFYNQYGFINIAYDQSNKRISNSSLISTDTGSPRQFGRPLGLYNDESLKDIFYNMMNSIGLTVLGVYSDN